MRFPIRDIVDSTGALLIQGEPSVSAAGVSTDSRTIAKGDFFFALSGPNYDGNRFARSAADRGAVGVMLRAATDAATREALDEIRRELPRDFPVCVHESPRRALSDLGSWHRSRLSSSVIGITGSCGKTSTKNILSTLLSSVSSVISSPNSYNNDIGVPHTLFLADEKTQNLIVEMGTSGPGEISGLCRTARPDAGIITTVGAAHLERLGSVEGVAKEKGSLAASLPRDGFCVLNADCQWTRDMRALTSARVITFSVEGEGDLNATDIWFHGGGTTFRLDGREVTSPLLGLHNVQNLLAAFAACLGLGLELDDVLPAVSALEGGQRRMERIDLDGGVTLYDDSYNANPESARASVRVLCGLHGHDRRVLVLGDMLELGDLAAELHHQVGLEAAQAGVDVLVLVGELVRATAAGALEGGLGSESVLHCDTYEDAKQVLDGLIRKGDVVLIKGSRATGLDRLVSKLTEERVESTVG